MTDHKKHIQATLHCMPTKHILHIRFKFYRAHQVEENCIVMAANITSKQNVIVHDTTIQYMHWKQNHIFFLLVLREIRNASFEYY